MLTLKRSQIAHLLRTGDTRWIQRGAYDLMDYQPQAGESSSKMPRGRSLYGSLPKQLKNENSFVSRLRDILAIRRRYGIRQIDIPAVSNKALLVMVHRLDSGPIQVTALNFSAIRYLTRWSPTSPPGRHGNRYVLQERLGPVDQWRTFPISLGPHQGMSVLVVNTPEADRFATAVGGSALHGRTPS